MEATVSLPEAARSVDCVNFGTLIQRSNVSRRSLARVLGAGGSALKLLNLTLRAGCRTEEIVVFSLENADILKLNEEEAGYLHAFLEGKGVEACLALGNAPGALAATRRGATGPIDREDVTRFARRAHEPVVDERPRDFAVR
jgi:hypothetical protein